jgi:hypothetical protein
MSLEKGMRKRVVRALRSLDAVSVENGVGAGTPDVNHKYGWIELKSIEAWPKRGGPLRIEHFTPGQRAWLAKRAKAGGLADLLIKVANDWILIDGMTAALLVGELDREQLVRSATWHSLGKFDKEGLLGCLTARGHSL